MRRGEWARARFTGIELRGRTLGILGLGKIGIALADMARGLEMTVIGHDPFVAPETAARHGVELVPFADLLARSDALTVHVPLTRTTRGRIGRGRAGRPAGRGHRPERGARRHHRRGRPRRGAGQRPPGRGRHRRLHRRAAHRLAPAGRSQHGPHAAPRGVHGRGPDEGRRGGRPAGPGRAGRSARTLRRQRAGRAAGDGRGARPVRGPGPPARRAVRAGRRAAARARASRWPARSPPSTPRRSWPRP